MKTIELTYGELAQAEQALAALDRCRNLKVTFAIKFSRMMQAARSEMQIFNGLNNKLLEKYGSQNGDGNYRIDPSSPNWQVFFKEQQELLSTAVELPWDRVTATEFVPDNILSPQDLISVVKFFAESE
jgi:hypothetical protein